MQFTPNTPTNSLRDVQIWTPIGTESVRVQGEHVLGRWGQQLKNFTGLRGRVLVEDFLNVLDDPDEIARFTKIYAPLDSEPSEGAEFRFSLQHWQALRSKFRALWEGRAGRSVSTTFSGSSYDVSVRDRSIVFHAKTLEGFMLIELATTDAKRLRKCVRPDCQNPYFIARHLKQQYCSTSCAEWAQVRWKKKWWEDKGAVWLEKQRKRRSARSVRDGRRKPRPS